MVGDGEPSEAKVRYVAGTLSVMREFRTFTRGKADHDSQYKSGFQSVVKWLSRVIDNVVKKCYELYFGRKADDHETSWALHMSWARLLTGKMVPSICHLPWFGGNRRTI